jgi:hypothetical protein
MKNQHNEDLSWYKWVGVALIGILCLALFVHGLAEAFTWVIMQLSNVFSWRAF